jgi:hypothetical protein
LANADSTPVEQSSQTVFSIPNTTPSTLSNTQYILLKKIYKSSSFFNEQISLWIHQNSGRVFSYLL